MFVGGCDVEKQAAGRGGARAGAGRRPGQFGTKETITLRLSPQLLSFLDTLTDTRAGYIEKVLRGTKPFKTWADSQ